MAAARATRDDAPMDDIDAPKSLSNNWLDRAERSPAWIAEDRAAA
jgi:hypothetical protein